MPPPVRTTDANYHFHVYDYHNAQPWIPSPAQAGRNNMQFYSMVEDLAGLLQTGGNNHVPNISLDRVGQSIDADGKSFHVWALSFGGPNDFSATPEVLITGGIHAREWVAPEMAYLLAEYLIVNYSNAAHGLTANQQFIQDLVNTRRIHIVPMFNPAGNDYTVFSPDQGARMWRINRRHLPDTAPDWRDALFSIEAQQANPPFRDVQMPNNVTSYEVPRYPPGQQAVYDKIDLPNTAHIGVDLNRNFRTTYYGHNNGSYIVVGGKVISGPNFAGATNSDPGKEDYFGPGAASEIETRNLQQFVRNMANLETSIDYHSYSQEVLYPTERDDSGAVDTNYSNLGKVLQTLIAPDAQSASRWSYNYGLGSPRLRIGYDATGTLADYVGSRNARSFVIELDPSGEDPGFELPEDKIRTVFEKNIRGALALVLAAGQQSTVSWWFGRTISSGESTLLTWNVYGCGNQLP